MQMTMNSISTSGGLKPLREICGLHFVFFFQLYFNNKYVEVAMNDLKMHVVIWKWLRRQRCRPNRKTMRKRGLSERRNCVQECFY